MDRVLLSSDMRHDIAFWLEFMTSFNGMSAVLDKQPITTVYTDACMAGCGGVYGNDWLYCNWALDWSTVDSLHINHKELLAVVLAAARWAPMWSGKRIYIMSDNIKNQIKFICTTINIVSAKSHTFTCTKSILYNHITNTWLYKIKYPLKKSVLI